MTDLISRADAIEAVQDHFNDNGFKGYNDGQKMMDRIKALPSAEANPTVVRCKTMIPYGDFREWAKRIREDNPNVIVIPFDAEVASADAVHGEWVIRENGNKECSLCGHERQNGWDYFCGYCGAKMKGADDE